MVLQTLDSLDFYGWEKDYGSQYTPTELHRLRELYRQLQIAADCCEHRKPLHAIDGVADFTTAL